MNKRPNPLKLNPLQAKTLTLFQVLAEVGDAESFPGGGARLLSLPQPHGNHFHLGPYVVMSADATGLANPAVWTALARRGLVRGDGAIDMIVTPEGLSYDTGLREKILHRSDH